MPDMVPTADFASMGVDSLMGITIIVRVQKELDVQLESNFFRENLTVADVQRALGYDDAEMMGLKEHVDGNSMEGDTGLASWFYSRRDNFAPNGWDKLLGDVVCRSLKADHFSMVTPPAVSTCKNNMFSSYLIFSRPTTSVNCYKRQ